VKKLSEPRFQQDLQDEQDYKNEKNLGNLENLMKILVQTKKIVNNF